MKRTVAYFSMEIAVDTAIPTYSGGLGVLAGDTVKAAADLSVPMVAVTLIHRRGYTNQSISPTGEQLETAQVWEPDQFLTRCEPTVEVILQGRHVKVRGWIRREVGSSGSVVPVYFLDTDLLENHPDDRRITDSLYGGDERLRLLQEIVLGVGGYRLLAALGYGSDLLFHLNEGHAAFLLLELIPKNWGQSGEGTLNAIRKRCVFTTHTPIAAGHDVFSHSLLTDVLTSTDVARLAPLMEHDHLNVTKLALMFAGTVNAVSRKHMDVTKQMFPASEIIAITNGVHPLRWASAPFVHLFDKYTPGWRQRGEQLRQAALIPLDEIVRAHEEARHLLFDAISKEHGMPFGGSGMLIGFARRATEYKRPLLIFRDIARLERMAHRFGPLNFIFAGKAHPRDGTGKELIKELHAIMNRSSDLLRVTFLPNYDMKLAALMCAGVDLWLNTPRAPLEASGTSGMKCALNGVPSLSINDGWWMEGGFDGVTGWVVPNLFDSNGVSPHDQDAADAEALYKSLEDEVLPCYFSNPNQYHSIMRNAISLNGSFFNTHRMIDQYRYTAYERY